MKTKLVYVLTCAPDDHYIEQALMSVWSARHWNPDAYIVLITDNLTDKLFVGKRAEILEYISQKIVVPFDDDSLSMVYRSRWLKTSVRQLVDGDFLFIDCDTIVCKSLEEVDGFCFEAGAVPEAMLPVSDFCQELLDLAVKRCVDIGVNLLKEEYYYCSGVIYAKDTPIVHKLYELWHKYWKQSYSIQMFADQPGLCKADIECGHLIQRISDTYDVIAYTHNKLYPESHILHILSHRNASYLGSKRIFAYVRKNGLTNAWLQNSILHPECTFFPFNNEIYTSSARDRRMWARQIAEYAKGYGQFIDSSFLDVKVPSRFHCIIHQCFFRKHYDLGAWLWLTWSYYHLHYKHFKNYENTCQKVT